MKYDPIKASLGSVVRRSPLLRQLFYTVLGIMFLREWYVKRELRRQLRRASAPFHIFDAGSGFGQYSYYMARKFPAVSIRAVDVKEEQIEDCRTFFDARGVRNCTFAIEDLLTITHQESFDFILSVDVMEHIADDRTVFRNFFRALRPGGRLFINTPSDRGGSDAGSSEDESFIGEHARNGYGSAEIREKLESEGFTVDYVVYSYGAYGSIAWRIGIKVPMLLLNISKVFFLALPVYYLLTLPIVLPLMAIDYAGTNRTGTGLNVLASKPESDPLRPGR